MDSGSDGLHKLSFNGKNQPGTNRFLVQNLTTSVAYNFKLRALNFNGAGLFSEQVTYYSCLPPAILNPP
jgi:hypothetical protein